MLQRSLTNKQISHKVEATTRHYKKTQMDCKKLMSAHNAQIMDHKPRKLWKTHKTSSEAKTMRKSYSFKELQRKTDQIQITTQMDAESQCKLKAEMEKPNRT